MKSMKVRTIPQLHFQYDASIRRGAELSALIERAGQGSHPLAGIDALGRLPRPHAKAALEQALQLAS